MFSIGKMYLEHTAEPGSSFEVAPVRCAHAIFSLNRNENLRFRLRLAGLPKYVIPALIVVDPPQHEEEIR